MTSPGNTLDDFPAETFTIMVFCASCDHRAPLDRARVPDGLSIQALPSHLRCAACGSRDASIRIIYTGAGTFRYGTPAKRSR